MLIDILDKEPKEPIHQESYANIGPAGFKMRVALNLATIIDNKWVECNLGKIPSLDMFISDLGIEVESTTTEEGLPVQKLTITGLVHHMERENGTD